MTEAGKFYYPFSSKKLNLIFINIKLKYEKKFMKRHFVFSGDCSCSNFVDNTSGFGNCQKIEIQTGPICYVKELSNCSDLLLSSRMERNYSSEACKNVPSE